MWLDITRKNIEAAEHLQTFLPSLNNTQGEVIKLLVIYRKMIAKHNSLEVMLNRWCHLQRMETGAESVGLINC